MATYKVIQDIEAEDKFVGPLTLKQFVFAAIGAIFSYLCFFVIVRGAWFVAVAFAPAALFGFFMAIPWSKDQPTDLWVLAKIRFRIKPKKRIWDQAGKQELVTITAPKKIEKVFTKDLSETEVESRLKALADTMNTRGWAVKHVGLSNLGASDGASDRLLPTPIPVGSRAALENEAPDILENTQVDALIDESERTRKAGLQDKIEQARKNLKAAEQQVQTVAPGDDAELLSEELRQRKKVGGLSTGKMQKFQPKASTTKIGSDKKKGKPSEKKKPETEDNKTISGVTEPSRPDIISLAHNNDLNVATLARQARNDDDESQEVVVSLH
jgi:hypothetical protein